MFKFKKIIKAAIAEAKQSFEVPRDPQVVIAEIHDAFDKSTDELLREAKKILAEAQDTAKGEKLRELGFYSSKPSIEASYHISLKQKNEALAQSIEYFRTFYPNYKFINEERVSEICKKYGLVCGYAYWYKGDVPEKNLKELEQFSLRDEEKSIYKCAPYSKEHPEYYGYFTPDYIYGGGGRTTFVAVLDTSTKEVTVATPMKICAPISDFNTQYMEVKNGYSLEMNLPDPIVLQPVKGGYLIVTKWGLEANDESLVNEINN